MLKSGLEIDRQMYKEECKAYKDMLEQAKCTYHRNEISNSDDKNLFRIVNKLYSMNSSRVLPDYTSPKELANRFGSFFHDKIRMICEKLDNVSTPPLTITLTESCKSSFTDFKQVSEDTVCKVINESASKCCQLDPIPTWLVKKCLDELLPHITKIINLSLSSATVPAALNYPTLYHC